MNIRIYNARILTMDGNYEVIEGELWVEGNRITHVGATTLAEMEGKSWNREIDAKANLLMPGFKNAHTHSGMTVMRSFADDLPLQEWLTQQIFPKEALLTPDDIYHLTKLATMEYLTSGITANFDMYLDTNAIAKAAVDCGFRTVQVGGINSFGGTVEGLEENYLKFNQYNPLCSYILGFHAEYTTEKSMMEGVSGLAAKYKAPVFMHNAETLVEVEGCKERYGITPTKLFDELGIYQYGGGGYHCVWMSEEDIEIFAKRKLTAVTNPGSNLKLASGIAPIQTFLNNKVAVAIGTDGPSSNNCLDMFREMFLTTGLAKVKEKDASSVDANEVLKMATVGGARAMGLTDCDTLAVGKIADFIMIDLQQPNMQPLNNISKNIVYSGSKQNVKMTVVDGNILYEDQQFSIGVDPQEVYAKANEIIARIR